jgi:MGT family glycosyltransferase
MRAGLGILELLAAALLEDGFAEASGPDCDLWVVDHLDYAASTLAAQRGVRFVSTCVTLMRHFEDGAPGYSGERPDAGPEALERDRRFEGAMQQASSPFRDYLDRWRAANSMPPFDYATIWSPLAQVSQQPKQFEFPRRGLPACFHFTGPFLDSSARPRIERTWTRDPARPLVYASFGTAQNRVSRLHEAVAGMAARLDAQVVLSLGGGDAEGWAGPNLTVARAVPQLEILQEADLMITHAGMNSALECLATGTPMVAVPISHDQPGVAARIEWTGTGVRLPAAECTADRLLGAARQVFAEPSYRRNAQRFQQIIADGRGLSRAADLVEGLIC